MPIRNFRPAELLELPADEAHIWYTLVHSCNTQELRSFYQSLLSDEETARLNRLRFDHLKLEYLVTRALCRTVLSTYADVPPYAWRFTINAYGRPEVDARGDAPPVLRFNLTNARTLVACIVTQSIDAGIDAEELKSNANYRLIADQYLSPLEREDVRMLPMECQSQRFVELWTLKESYIKARGIGLSIPLNTFSFKLDGPSIRIAFDVGSAEPPAHWMFHLYRPGNSHVMAAALRTAGGPPVRLHVREVIPDHRIL